MTRFERACISPHNMAITAAMCVVPFIEKWMGVEMDNEGLQKLLLDASDGIERWLNEEVKK